jgi:hypothetical protein
MIVKILGILDIITALSLWLFFFFHIVPEKLVLLLAFYLLAKGIFILTSRDITSIIDVISAGLIFLALNFTIPGFIIIIVTLFLLQKGIFSLLG